MARWEYTKIYVHDGDGVELGLVCNFPCQRKECGDGPILAWSGIWPEQEHRHTESWDSAIRWIRESQDR